jgi:hypothetical protein
MMVTNLSSATLSRSSGLYCVLREEFTVAWIESYRFSNASTEDLTTGNVVARCFLDEQNAKTVFIVLKIFERFSAGQVVSHFRQDLKKLVVDKWNKLQATSQS